MKYFIRIPSIYIFSIIIFISCNDFQVDAKSVVKPNFIVVFVDDMGYGDLASYGHPTINTPNLDKMAYEGQKWTQFYLSLIHI